MALIETEFRRPTALKGGKGPIATRSTHFESMAVAQVEPPGFEMSRAGRRFLLGNSAAITGLAPVATLPTTTATWALWNADPAKAALLEQLGMYLTAGTPAAGGVLLGCLYQQPVSVGALYAGTAISSASSGASASKMIVKNAVTITQPAAPNWFVIASNSSPNVTAFPGTIYIENRDLQGRIVIPPGQGLGLAVVAAAGTTPLFAPFGMWCELESDLE